MADKVVKINAELLERIEKLVKKEKYKYSSNKQVVNLAILEFLNHYSVDSRKEVKNE